MIQRYLFLGGHIQGRVREIDGAPPVLWEPIPRPSSVTWEEPTYAVYTRERVLFRGQTYLVYLHDSLTKDHGMTLIANLLEWAKVK